MLRASRSAPFEGQVEVGGGETKGASPSDELDGQARSALRGDAAALRAFLLAIAPVVRRVCRGVMGRQSVDLEDTIQECLIDVARSLPQFRFEGAVAHYVTKIALRRAIGSRQRARERSKQHTALEAIPARAASFDGALEARADLVRNLLDELNEEQAKALLLRIMLGHSIDEIAGMTGVSVNTVKTRLRLAKDQLRRWLQRSGEGRRDRD
jgi:RNA polymerase sigma-70 factor (ECF subfamily)